MDTNNLKRLAGIPVVSEKKTFSATQKQKAPNKLLESGSRAQISAWLKESHSDFSSAVITVNAFIKESGRDLTADRLGMFDVIKNDMRRAFETPAALEPFNLSSLRKMAGLPVSESDDEEMADEPEVGELAADSEVPTEDTTVDDMLASVASEAEGKTGDEMVEVIRQVYDAGFNDGKESVATEEMPVEEEVDSKGKQIKAGSKLIWKDVNGEHTGTVEADAKYNGGLKVGGRSVKNIIDDSDSVMVVEAKAPKQPVGNLTASVGVDKEDDAGWMAVELAKAGMTVDMEEAMGVFYFNFKTKADEAKAKKLAQKLQIATV